MQKCANHRSLAIVVTVTLSAIVVLAETTPLLDLRLGQWETTTVSSMNTGGAPAIDTSKMTPAQKELLFGNTARAIGAAAHHIQQRHIANCMRADPAYGTGVAKALGISVGF